jgi:hypothetical protein
MNDREISKIVRADILRVLWERGDNVQMLKASDLQSTEYERFFEGSVDWLVNEGLLALGNSKRYWGAPPVFSGAQLTKKGEDFLETKLEGFSGKLGDFLIEVVRDATKATFSDVAKNVPLLVWTTYEVWKASKV